MVTKIIQSLIFAFLVINVTLANNISVTNVLLTGQDVGSDYIMVEFDISWENSWRVSTGPSNWDAAWVFIKYRKNAQGPWEHCTLNYSDGTGSGDGHTEPANTNIASSEDNGSGGAYGVFIYRDSDMAQADVSYTDVKLRWNYGDDGLDDSDVAEVCVYAIEMVYVPQGSFEIGCGLTANGCFFTYGDGTSSYEITSENEVPVSTTNGDLYHYVGTRANIPANFPKGYDAYYCMKYEITQEQYVSFLNKLDDTQASLRDNEVISGTGLYRNEIIGNPGGYSTTNEYVAANYLCWRDLAAYLDWAALRPMTELEYEKAARGDLAAVRYEYAWGTTFIAEEDYTLSNEGDSDEGIATNFVHGGGNALVSATAGVISGPVRVGIFAAYDSYINREVAGSGWYGAMELSGNVTEYVINVSTANGIAFTGEHGDGELTSAGASDVTNWPNSTTDGFGLRGGHHGVIATYARVSDRQFVLASYETTGYYFTGGRGVRTAP